MNPSPHLPRWKAILAAFLLTALAPLLAQDLPEAVIIGRFSKGPVGVPIKVDAANFSATFGSSNPLDWPAELQATRFFIQGGPSLHVIRATPDGTLHSALIGNPAQMTGLHALPLIRNFGILICPELTTLPAGEIPAALATTKAILGQRRATLILDPPAGWTTITHATTWVTNNIPTGTPRFTLYYPYLRATIGGTLRTFGASGTIAATWLKNDTTTNRGIWSTPAGTHLPIIAESLSHNLNSGEQTILNNNGIGFLLNSAPHGIIPWSARHLNGGTNSTDTENRYINIQRTSDWIDHRILRNGHIHATHRLNNTTLWSSLKTQTEAILGDLHSRGAFAGTTAAQSYFVQCGQGTTMTNADIAAGKVIVLIGTAMLRPGEFRYTTYTWNTRTAAFPPPPPIILQRPGANSLTAQLFHYTSPGTTGTLRTTTDLTHWTNLTNPQPGDGTWQQHTHPRTDPKRFFRLEQTELLAP